MINFASIDINFIVLMSRDQRRKLVGSTSRFPIGSGRNFSTSRSDRPNNGQYSPFLTVFGQKFSNYGLFKKFEADYKFAIFIVKQWHTI